MVAHKTGNLPGVVNDAAVVAYPEGEFVIVAMVSDTQDEDQAALTIAELARTCFDFFS